MSFPPETAVRLRLIAATLDRYILRHGQLVAEVEEQTALAATAEGYEQMRAANNAKAAKAKIALYEPEIELLRHQLERMAEEAGLSSTPVPVTREAGVTEVDMAPDPGAPDPSVLEPGDADSGLADVQES